jgi:hypothetical protein
MRSWCVPHRRPPALISLAAGAILVAGACGGSPAAPSIPAPPAPTSSWIIPVIPANVSVTVKGMLGQLVVQLASALAENQSNLPRNPQNAAQIQAKIAMLQNPSLAVDIVNAARWAEGQSSSMNGRAIPIAVVFPLDEMRGQAAAGVQVLAPILPLLEQFYNLPFPANDVRVWYGFKIGNSGGGGAIFSEDRATYEGRTDGSRLPFDAILAHELGHSYMGHESLNQFLEIYDYNVPLTGSTDPLHWPYTRSWVPGSSSNVGVLALLDIYQLIGLPAMEQAYRAIYPLHPPYGAVLSQAVIDAFAMTVPESQRDAVRAKLASVGF